MDPNIFRQGGLFIPAQDPDSKYLLVCLHGSQGSARDFEGLEEIFNNPKLNYLYLNGSIPAYSAYRWYTEVSETRLNAIQYLNQIFDTLQNNGYPPEKTFLLGFSQGANIVFEFGARYKDLLAGYIAISGRIEEITSLLNESNPKVVKNGKWFVTHGKNDVNLSITIMETQVETLRKEGYRIEFQEFDKAHEFESTQELPAIADWINQII